MRFFKMNNMKLKGTTVIMLFLVLFQPPADARETTFEQLSAHFELRSFSILHVYLPITYSFDFSPLDPYPYKGKKIKTSLMKFLGRNVHEEYDTYYALYVFYISPSVVGFIIRRGGDAQFFDSSLDLYVYDKKTDRCIQVVSLAGYAHGESGGVFWAGWLQDINNDGAPDIITRKRSGTWEQLESPLNDAITVYLWQADEYKEYTPRNRKAFLQSYPVIYNPFGVRNVSLKDIDPGLKPEEQVFKIVLSSDADLEAARYEERRFNEAEKSDGVTLYFSDMLYCCIYKKHDRFYTVVSGSFARNKAELILMDLRKVFPTAWLEDQRMWCPDEIYNKEGFWECSQ
jgi:hypothetical protein